MEGPIEQGFKITKAVSTQLISINLIDNYTYIIYSYSTKTMSLYREACKQMLVNELTNAIKITIISTIPSIVKYAVNNVRT